jgi:hypothetical protein
MMKISMFKNADLLLIGRRSLIVLALGSAISMLAVGPALAERNDDHGRGKQSQRGWQGDHGARGWHGDRQAYRYQPGYRYPYAQPVYVPPPVYYEPRQSPGISLFFPLDLRR